MGLKWRFVSSLLVLCLEYPNAQTELVGQKTYSIKLGQLFITWHELSSVIPFISKLSIRCENMSSHIRLNCTSHLTPVMTLITDQSTSYSEVWKLNFIVHPWSLQVSNPFLHKYNPLQVKTSSLLMKTSRLRLKLVELNFFASFTTDDQSNSNVPSYLI